MVKLKIKCILGGTLDCLQKLCQGLKENCKIITFHVLHFLKFDICLMEKNKAEGNAIPRISMCV